MNKKIQFRNDVMRNLIIYYLAILIPLLLIVHLAVAGSSIQFIMFLLIYLLPYRTFVDGSRLVNKQVITWGQIWKLLIPGERIHYFKELYFRK